MFRSSKRDGAEFSSVYVRGLRGVPREAREMAELSKRRKEIDQTKSTLAASKREADDTRQTMAAETKHCGRETEKKRRQFTVWRVKILPPKQSSRLTRRFNRLLRRH
ncbi:hypothetical protein OS493_019135 [Desmophyllum pertusum]|uniref:Uncharacterized protein n=1 Tax=Desmophyllum pertusum TaxID=174260 RepID=A0A9W9YNF4_9CNID|nr:hypothetical protein OS493_019135 [Desmophyllum pertusum]